MTLRTRIAAVASLSVALAVLAAAVGLYVAVRSDLQGEVDQGLRQRAQAFVGPSAGGSAGSEASGSSPSSDFLSDCSASMVGASSRTGFCCISCSTSAFNSKVGACRRPSSMRVRRNGAR